MNRYFSTITRRFGISSDGPNVVFPKLHAFLREIQDSRDESGLWDGAVHDFSYSSNHISIVLRSGTPPACTTFPSITTPGVDITP